MAQRVLAFLFFLLVFNFVKGQEKVEWIVFGDSSKVSTIKRVVLTGTIIESDSKIPLGGASIFIDGLKYGNNSDAFGRYLIELPPGNYRLTVRYLGNIPIHKRISIFENGVIHFSMIEKPKVLEEVIVSARSSDENIREIGPGLIQLGIKEIKRIPAFMGEVDIVKSLLLLPGIATVGEGSGGFNVRGGATDQNLVLMDNGQIFNSAHALGLFSNFNPDVTEEFTLYKGNIPAQFGGRASSVLNVRTRDGDFSKFKVKGGVGFLSSRVAVEGPIVKDKTSFIIGGRVSYSDWILKTVKNLDVQNSSASFYDLNANITHRFSSGGNMSLRYYQGHDYFRYSNQFGYDYTTQLLSFRWNSLLGKNWGSTFSATQGKYTSKLLDLDVTQAKQFSNGISYSQLKQNFLHTYKEVHALNLGAEANLYSSLPEKSQPLGTNSTTTSQQLKKGDGREFSLYANEEYTLNKVFSFSLGLRYSLFQSVGNDTVYQYQPGLSRSVGSIIDTLYYSPNHVTQTYQGFEPRVSVRIGAGKNGAFKLAYNRNRQYIHLVSNTTAPTPTDIWQLSNSFFKPQIADNFSAGYFQNFTDNKYEFSAEVFYKSLTNIVDYKNSAQIILNRHLETDVLQGKGKYYGLELYIKKNTGYWKGWASYTYSRAFNQINGAVTEDKINNGSWYPSNYDKPHNFSLTASHYLGRIMTFGANLTYSTGRPITAIESYYYANEISVPVYSDRNKYRIPDYWRVDISITVNSVFKKIDDSLVFSVYNFFGRRNAYSIYYQEIYGQQTLHAYKLSVLGSALPSLTYNINF
jgi:hypothetical protein